MKIPLHSSHAPAAIGTYSQAVRAGDTVYVSGQIGFDPATMHPARAAIGVASLPRGALVEIDCILYAG